MAIKTWLKKGRVGKIILHKRESGVNRIGDLELIQAQAPSLTGSRRARKQVEAFVDKTLIIEARWGHWKLSEGLHELFRGDGADPNAIAELVSEPAFGPQSVDVTLEADGRSKTFKIGSSFRVSEDITERLQGIPSGDLFHKKVFTEAREYLVALGS
jgi:hypothetical protein